MFQVPNGSSHSTLIQNVNRECMPPPSGSGPSANVDDGLTSLSWLQNLNMCMTRLGAPTPPTPPASPNNKPLPPFSTASASSLYASYHVLSQRSENLHPSLPFSSSSSITHPYTPSPPKRSKKTKKDNVSHHTSNLDKLPPPAKEVKKSCVSSENINGNSNLNAAAHQEVIDYKLDGSVKPPFSYATLICMAMKASNTKMTLNSIYKWIRENFLYYQNADPSWQNSIRHNLSLNKCFIKIPRTKEEPGKGGFWRLDPLYAETLVDGVFKKRRPAHRLPGSSTSSSSRKKRKKDKNLDKELSEGNIPLAEVAEATVSITDVNSVQIPSRDSVIEGCMPRNNTIHETPPNSAESYPTIIEGGACETIELVNAVNNIDPSLQVNGGVPCHYQVYGTTVPSAYGEEVCIQSLPVSQCVMGPSTGGHENGGGSDIAWNAILSENDLEFANPINYSCQVVQHENSNTTCNCDECIVGNLMTNFIP